MHGCRQVPPSMYYAMMHVTNENLLRIKEVGNLTLAIITTTKHNHPQIIHQPSSA